MPKKHLSINLADPASIRNSINQIRAAKYKVTEAYNKMIIAMTEELVEVIKINASTMLGTSWAGESIHATYITGADGLYIGQVWGADYIVYIEYGTGRVGAANPNAERPAGWVYSNKSWVYYDDRIGFVTTEGQKAKPFIRKSVEQVRAHAKQKAEVTFYEWIATT